MRNKWCKSRRSPLEEQYSVYRPGYKWINTSLGIWVNFQLVLKSPSVNILRSRCETVISVHRLVPLPPLTDIHPHTNIHTPTWLTREAGSMLFLLLLSSPKDKLIFSFSNTWQGNCNGCLCHSAVSVAFLNLLLYYLTGGVLEDQKVLPFLQSGVLDLLLETRANCFVLCIYWSQEMWQILVLNVYNQITCIIFNSR